MKIVFMGTPEFAVPSLEALVAAGHQVVGVFSQPDKPKNRGMKLQPTPVKLCAMVHGLPVYQPTKLRDGTALETIRSLEPDLIVVAAYGRILPQEILDYPKYGCINVHSSLLPKYRGAAPIHWSILNGDKETGVTIMHMALALDAGDIISQVTTPIDPDETVETLHDRLARLGADRLGQVGQELLAAHRPAGHAAQVIAVQPHVGQLSIDRRLGHDGGRPLPFEQGEDRLGREPVAVVDEEGHQAQPLAVELGAGDDLPPRVARGEVDRAVVSVLHVPRAAVVGQRVDEVVQHALRPAGRAGGEVEEHRVVTGRRDPVPALRLGGQEGVEVLEPLRRAVDGQPHRHGPGAVGRRPDARRGVPVPAAHHAPGPGGLHPIGQVVLRQEVVDRREDQPQLVRRQRDDPILPVAAQGGHEHLAPAQTAPVEQPRRPVAQGPQVREGQVARTAAVVAPAHRHPVRMVRRQRVGHVVAIIEIGAVLVAAGDGPPVGVEGLVDEPFIGLCHGLAPFCLDITGSAPIIRAAPPFVKGWRGKNEENLAHRGTFLRALRQTCQNHLERSARP